MTVAIIYRTVQPLTLSTVASVLREADAEAGSTFIPLIQACHVSNTGSKRAYPSRRAKFTPTECLGPHDEADCYSKPENAAKREKWISNKESERNGHGRHQRKPSQSIRGMKTVGKPNANLTMMSFCTTFGDVSVSESYSL